MQMRQVRKPFFGFAAAAHIKAKRGKRIHRLKRPHHRQHEMLQCAHDLDLKHQPFERRGNFYDAVMRAGAPVADDMDIALCADFRNARGIWRRQH